MGMAAPHVTLWLDVDFWDLAKTTDPVLIGVLGFLVLASLLSWTIIFSKFFSIRSSRSNNRKFLRAFRKATRLDAVAAASEQYRSAPLVGVFDFGYSEVCRQMAARGQIKVERIVTGQSMRPAQRQPFSKPASPITPSPGLRDRLNAGLN